MTPLLTSHRIRSIAFILFLLLFAQIVGAGPHLSLTADEPVHMAQGYVYWTRGDFRLQRPVAQPPLPDLLPGIFLVLQPGPEPESLSGWEDADLSRFSRAFVKWYGPDLASATFVSRFPIALTTILGAAFVFRWAREIFGAKGALVPLIFFAFDPNFIAHAGLATTDVLVAIWTFIAVYAAQKWAEQRGGVGWAAVTGVSLGLALGSKTSGFFATGIVGILFASYVLMELMKQDSWRSRIFSVFRWTGRLVGVVVLGLIVLWILYRFEFRPLPGTWFPIPFTTHWIIWGELQTHLLEGHVAYLMGEIRHTGWWIYYPVAFLLKTPLPTLLLFGAMVVVLIGSGAQPWWRWRSLWLVPFLYSGAAVTSSIDIGYRYLLVMLPFLYVLCGMLALHLRKRWQYVGLLGGVIWLIIGTLRIFPHYLTFFNECVGGASGGYHYLVDSNLDWGQGFIALRDWLDTQSEQEPLYLSYYTYTDPSLYGLDYEPLPPAHHGPAAFSHAFNPDPGLYAISATTLQGVMLSDPNAYAWFRNRTPVARPGNSIFVYRVVSPASSPGWVAQCLVPFEPLPSDAIEERFGEQNLRELAFDCTQSWVYPGAVDQAGWYALAKDVVTSEDPFVKARLSEAVLSYQQRFVGGFPPFALYEQVRLPESEFAVMEEPIDIESLRLLGYKILAPQLVHPGTGFEVLTFWEVLTLPERHLSIMLHLVSPSGAHLSAGDGLGFPVASWQVGDIFIQRHSFVLPGDAPEGTYTLNAGVYWLDDLSRWEVREGEVVIGDQIPLEFSPRVAQR